VSDDFTPDIVESFPGPDDVERYHETYGIAINLIERDIARLVLIAVLRDRDWLNEDCVLTGGMALRLRGSTRFTMLDSDTSIRGPFDEIELAGKMTINDDNLVVTPDDGTNWDRRTKLTIAQPITYYPYFSAVGPDNVEKDEFTFTVSQRGLHLPAKPLALVTPYPELVFTREVLVPCMHITEQAAEKAVGWAAAGLRKHYLDLAWIGDNHADEIETPDFQKMTQKKLDAGYEAHGDAYEDYREWKSLLRPLMRPNDHVAPLKRDPTKRESEIRFIGNQPPLRWDQAIKIMQGVILKKLFGEAKAE
jgi:nucleotidyltransferase AbiEii toxin of type IV toxin-antitoxin system